VAAAADDINPEPGHSYAEPPLFASTIDEPRRAGGVRMWFVAALSLVVGIGIGFASGYRVGGGETLFTTRDANAAEAPASPDATETSGQTFSESSVGDPVHLEPQTVVPSPESAPAPVPAPPAPVPAPAPAPAAVPAPAPAPRAVPRAQAPAAPALRPGPVASGPGSLEVVSRPAGAQVYLDGRSVGRTPLSIPNVESGAHSVRLDLPGYNSWSTTVDVKAGGSLRVAASLEQ
jgi:hypothetical protein